MEENFATAVFGGGCFWCTEAVFRQLRGVRSVMSGYADGSVEKPSYEDVSSGKTGHAEVVKIEYDPRVISFRELLAVFFSTHNPTTPNRQGNDVGEQYRSTILYTNDEQKREAKAFIKELGASLAYDKPIVTEVKALGAFYAAEAHHQNYYEHNRDKPYCQMVINPKLEKLREKHAELLKNPIRFDTT